jgi:hypothetical protein
MGEATVQAREDEQACLVQVSTETHNDVQRPYIALHDYNHCIALTHDLCGILSIYFDSNALEAERAARLSWVWIRGATF